ncbi:hypothetical protein [Paenibacillus alkalitolerans]|uniref:hypothetical protein n=1 Tax=Paenibacillus alkalitolerans TaxID=2799335 RepID=UPI0018F632D6|nr:hypothetical protein [Paenibacillus alkalitolerans]
MTVVVMAAAGLVWYAAPSEQLDWTSGPPPSIRDKVEQMILERRAFIQLSETEIDALLKQYWKRQAVINEYAVVTGARFELTDNVLLAHTTVRLADTADAALVHEFRLDWEAPDIVITHLSTRMKNIEFPKDWIRFEQTRLPLELDPRLPVAVKSVEFMGDVVEIQMNLRAPGLFNN